MMRRVLAILAVLSIGGCVSTNGPSADTSASAKPSPTKDSGEDSDQRKPLCVDTIEGTESKTVCY